MVRDLSIWDRQCWLRLTPRRFKCSTCQSTFVERLAWREPNCEYTMRYEQYIYQRTRKETVLQVAKDEQLSEEIIQGIFERWAKNALGAGVVGRNGFAEGVNLKIRMIHRKAFGYRNFEQFRLHIFVAFDPLSR